MWMEYLPKRMVNWTNSTLSAHQAHQVWPPLDLPILKILAVAKWRGKNPQPQPRLLMKMISATFHLCKQEFRSYHKGLASLRMFLLNLSMVDMG
jgi:hypothetical protein